MAENTHEKESKNEPGSLGGRRTEGRESGPSPQEIFEEQTAKIDSNLKATIHQYRKWVRFAVESGADENHQNSTLERWMREMQDGSRRGDREAEHLLRERSTELDGEKPRRNQHMPRVGHDHRGYVEDNEPDDE